MYSKIRKPSVAGMFYPENSTELKNLILSLLEENKPSKKYNNIVGIVSPHAGYKYSGKSAAVAYNVLNENSNFETAIILSPSHQEYFKGCCIYNGDAYETPLGEISIEKEISKFLVENNETIFFGSEGHKEEHALEVQLPFLQVIRENFSIVPIVIGDQSIQYILELIKGLSQVINDKTIIIASTDLSHFHSKEKAAGLDNIIINRINNFEFQELYNDLALKNCEACGGGGIVALLEIANSIGDNKAEVLSYTDSGDVLNDNTSVVGYLSAVVYGDE